jgi:hypothetical protein
VELVSTPPLFQDPAPMLFCVNHDFSSDLSAAGTRLFALLPEFAECARLAQYVKSRDLGFDLG